MGRQITFKTCQPILAEAVVLIQDGHLADSQGTEQLNHFRRFGLVAGAQIEQIGIEWLVQALSAGERRDHRYFLRHQQWQHGFHRRRAAIAEQRQRVVLL